MSLTPIRGDFVWTHHHIAILRKMTAEKKSAREVADFLGVTRGAVIKKRIRLGINPGQPAPQEKRPKVAKSSTVDKSWPFSVKASVSIDKFLVAFQMAAGDSPKAFDDLTGADCKWPLDDSDGNTAGFCASPRLGERVYCARHCMIAYAPSRRQQVPANASSA